MALKETVSVVVPIFNVDKYLNESLNSLKKQTYKEFEVIMIDDASTDNSYRIAEKYLTDKRFKLFKNTVNKGLSGTRNRGIELATGKYIFYFDPDDLLPINLFELLVNEIKLSQSDLLCFNYLKFSDEFPQNVTSIVKKKEFNQIETIKLLLSKKLTPAPWAYLTYLDILKENKLIRFPEGKNFEDITYIPYLITHINKLSLLKFDRGGYYYRVNRKGSITDVNNNLKKLTREINDRVTLDTVKYEYLSKNYEQLTDEIKNWYFDELIGLYIEKFNYLYEMPDSANVFNEFRRTILNFTRDNSVKNASFKDKVKLQIIKNSLLGRIYYMYKKKVGSFN